MSASSSAHFVLTLTEQHVEDQQFYDIASLRRLLKWSYHLRCSLGMAQWCSPWYSLDRIIKNKKRISSIFFFAEAKSDVEREVKFELGLNFRRPSTVAQCMVATGRQCVRYSECLALATEATLGVTGTQMGNRRASIRSEASKHSRHE